MVYELLGFTWREARSCIFAGSFFVVLALSQHLPLGPIPRYDFLFLAALLMQVVLVATRFETLDELKTLCLFHALGFCLEVFKTHPSVGSWSYPEPGYVKLFGVPLYSGFMYAAVASYMVQAWRQLELEPTNYPSKWLTLLLAFGIYVNFFTHHFVDDVRWFLTALLILLFRKTKIRFTPWRRRLWLPLPLGFALIGFFVWVAENIATFFGAWAYPHQHQGWHLVGFDKISSWGLLVVITFVIVADLKFFKLRGESNTPPTSERNIEPG
jgi:uncharacterized membrane protein YoaT (DUF817 family)